MLTYLVGYEYGEVGIYYTTSTYRWTSLVDLRSGPAVQSTHHLRTVQTIAEGTAFSGSMNTAFCDIWYEPLRKTLTYLLTYLLTWVSNYRLSFRSSTTSYSASVEGVESPSMRLLSASSRAGQLQCDDLLHDTVPIYSSGHSSVTVRVVYVHNGRALHSTEQQWLSRCQLSKLLTVGAGRFRLLGKNWLFDGWK